MLNRLKSLFTAPYFEDEIAWRAGLLQIILVAALLIVAAGIPLLLLFAPPEGRSRVVATYVALFTAEAILLLLLRRGHVNLAAQLAPAAHWIVVTTELIVSGGMPSASSVGYPFHYPCSRLAHWPT